MESGFGQHLPRIQTQTALVLRRFENLTLSFFGSPVVFDIWQLQLAYLAPKPLSVEARFFGRSKGNPDSEVKAVLCW